MAYDGQARRARTTSRRSSCLRARPELNPVENVWQYLRQNWLSNTVFETYDAIIDAACDAWRKLIAQPETITSIGMRDWAHVGHPHDLWYYLHRFQLRSRASTSTYGAHDYKLPGFAEAAAYTSTGPTLRKPS